MSRSVKSFKGATTSIYIMFSFHVKRLYNGSFFVEGGGVVLNIVLFLNCARIKNKYGYVYFWKSIVFAVCFHFSDHPWVNNSVQ